MYSGSGFSVWDDLVIARESEDERLFQHFARAGGQGMDRRAVRDIVSQARSMLGLEAIFCDLDLIPHDDSHEVVVWYEFPPAPGKDTRSLEAVSFLIDAAAPSRSPRATAGPPSRRRHPAAGAATRTHHCSLTSALRAAGTAARGTTRVLRSRVASRPSGGSARPPAYRGR